MKDLNEFLPSLMSIRCFAFIFLSLFLLQPAFSETVTFKSGAETISAYLATPKEKGSRPAMILIHEWWGLNDWIKESAKRFSEKGYVALAIDLYMGNVATDADTAHQLMRGLPQDRALRDIQAAVQFLSKRYDVQRHKISIIGWCMGGGLSLQAALNVKGLSAAVVCYGSVPSEQENVSKLSVPLLGIFGETDKGIPVSSVKAFEKTAESLKKHVTVHIYPGVDHAFMNPNSKNYGEKQANDAWQKIFEFFAVHGSTFPFDILSPDNPVHIDIIKDITVLASEIAPEILPKDIEWYKGRNAPTRYEAAVIIVKVLVKLPSCDYTKTNASQKCKGEIKNILDKNTTTNKKLDEFVKMFERLTTEFKDELAALGL